jgi:hypothetical protein
MKYFAVLLILGVFLSINSAFAMPLQNSTDVSTFLFDYKNKPNSHPCYFEEPPKPVPDKLMSDIGCTPEDFEEKMGKFLLEFSNPNSKEINLKVALLDKQDKPIPHVGFFT